MKHGLMALMIVVSLASIGCKKKSESGGGDMLGKMTELKNKMCECKPGDKACADKVSADMKAWSDQHTKSGAHTSDPEMTKKMEPINKQYADCMTKATTPAGAEGSATAMPGSGSAGSDHGSMDHGSGSGAGSAMGSGAMDHGSAHGSGHQHK